MARQVQLGSGYHDSVPGYAQRLSTFIEHQLNGSIHAALGPPSIPVLRQVPQHTYAHSRQAVFHTAKPPIVFNVDSHRGVTLVEAYQNGGLLTGATDQIWLGSRTKISHRLRVIGQQPYNYDKQVPSCRSTVPATLLSRRKIAFHVAATVKDCLAVTGGMWRLLDGTELRFEHLLLLELRHVSEGSWQPVLGYYYMDSL